MIAWITEWATVVGVVIAALGVIAAVVVPVAIHLHNRSFRGTSKGRASVVSTCPHAFLDLQEDPFGLRILPAFVSPMGRMDYECQRCRLNGIYDENVVTALTYKPSSGISLLDIVKDFNERERTFAKALKRYEG